MQIIAEERRVIMSVGAFAGFGSPAAHSSGISGLWRMETGRVWHEEMQNRAKREYGVSAQFERPVAGLLKAHGWTFELSGRIDQIIT
ncbi:MAG: hypothetical protein AAGB06_04435, partial [Verrucomicrobiota bacterium]